MKNPKLAGSNIIDCRPQVGSCPRKCNQCFYNNMPDEYKKKPIIPTPEEAAGKIVRMNAEHDSNIEKELVIETALQYENSFFNTSIPEITFPRPVVLTVNPLETADPLQWHRPLDFSPSGLLNNIMFVRLKVDAVTEHHAAEQVVREWTLEGVPVVLTFMRYYTEEAPNNLYERAVHFKHECWQIPERMQIIITSLIIRKGGPLVMRCGHRCSDCRTCESLYWISKNRMKNLGTWR